MVKYANKIDQTGQSLDLLNTQNPPPAIKLATESPPVGQIIDQIRTTYRLSIPAAVQIVYQTPEQLKCEEFYEEYHKSINTLLIDLNTLYFIPAINACSITHNPFHDEAERLQNNAYNYFNRDDVKTYYSPYIDEETIESILKIIKKSNWTNRESIRKIFSNIKILLGFKLEI